MALVDFPKSHSIEKALRKQGHEEEADQFAGYGTGLKPSYEPILLCQKPLTIVPFYDMIIETQNLIGGLLCLLLSNASNAEKISKLSPVVPKEVSASAQMIVALLHGAKSGELYEMTDMFSSQETVSTCLSIAKLWSIILGEILKAGSTFTISTETVLITGLKTLNCLLSTNIQAEAILAVSRPVGSKSYVSVVENISPSGKQNLQKQSDLFAAVLASLDMHRDASHARNAAINLQAISPSVVSVLGHVLIAIATESEATELKELASIVDANFGQFHQGQRFTAIENAWQKLTPDHEPIILAMKPLDSTFANNALTWGVAGLNIDGGRVPTNGEGKFNNPISYGARHATGGYSGGLERDGEITYVTPPSGRFPANLILSHHSECVRVGTREVKTGMHIGHNLDKTNKSTNTVYGTYNQDTNDAGYANADGFEFVSAYDCHPQCPIRLLGEQAGIRASGGREPGTNTGTVSYKLTTQVRTGTFNSNTGTAARYFLNLDGETRFFYCSKASRRERNEGLEGMEEVGAQRYNSRGQGPLPQQTPPKNTPESNHHPCVKPLKLMEYLCILTRTPTGGVVLDPFMGSGSTGVACVNTGRDFIGIERDAEYYTITERRIEYAQQQVRQLELAL